ncbi:MAG TPA: replication-associated recombination protein A [Flavobacteriales bacterium]|nr:AAA family ATPase [Flavobacteriales bacterium]HRE73049.1 replication-associated recombination protein A [Flavobacteriales bacterium]HRE96753.1 replication-associated recombination protein A [Flavobacteriales bacterium]HRJ35575.1 replication-associated recombination protein A [Flavobacteriales bacterium]HRJ37750.1 replication-associated recombination protein A [Flavobacteriales bacterium]
MEPLAERMRPGKLENYIGQEHLIGENAILRKTLATGNIPSMILWGPPGVGKTTLAQLISTQLKRPFYTLSAINSGVKDIREVIEKVGNQGLFGGNSAVLFIDEIHRFSKSQQDSLLGAVERGIITLIGATTENPSFEVIPALLSRCQVYVLRHLEKEDLEKIIRQAIANDELLNKREIELIETDALIKISGGDARKLLNALELVIQSSSPGKISITNESVTSVIQNNLALYDKNGEQHYDIISAFIKSIRGSDPNAAVYYLARMVEGGEDPLFIARRMLILASEDIGNANPNALLIATSTFQAVSMVGWPESRIILSQCALFLATSPKSNASYEAINAAQELVRTTGSLSVPLSIRNAPTRLMKELGYGEKYKYAHSYKGNFAEQEFLPEAISGTKIYNPGNNKREEEIRAWLKARWKEKYGY